MQRPDPSRDPSLTTEKQKMARKLIDITVARQAGSPAIRRMHCRRSSTSIVTRRRPPSPEGPTMAGHVRAAAVKRAGIEPGEVEVVVLGCGMQQARW
jgi:hypothetical protein